MDFSYHELPYTISEGIISTIPRVSSRVLFYPSLIYTMLMEKFSTREWFSRVNDHLIIGALPFKSMAQYLVDKEVTEKNRQAGIKLMWFFEDIFFSKRILMEHTGVLGKPGRQKSSKSRPDYPNSSELPQPSGLLQSLQKPIFLFEIPNYLSIKGLAQFPRLR